MSVKGQLFEKPEDLIKEPLLLEFLGLEDKHEYSENDLENAIINRLEKFLLELGKGFLFQGRQVRFTIGGKHYRADLVLYHRYLRCFVILDLKIGRIAHKDIGQMQMYVNYYDRNIREKDENKTIGIILCRDKSNAMVEMTLPEANNQIFAAKYKIYLPGKNELIKIVKGNY